MLAKPSDSKTPQARNPGRFRNLKSDPLISIASTHIQKQLENISREIPGNASKPPVNTMSLPENQPTAQQTDWRAKIHDLRAVDGWQLTCETDAFRVVPVKGKSPGVSGAGWQHKTFTLEEVIEHPHATGCGLVTGPQPIGDSVICIDFDGPAAVHYANNHGLTTEADFNTWQVLRTDGPDEEGKKAQPTPGRVKLFYRATPEQAKELGDEFILSHNLVPQNKTTGAKKEALEVFHHKGKQAVVLGAHPDGGHYFWPEGHGPETLKVLPDGMFRLILQADRDAAAAMREAIASVPPMQPASGRSYSGSLSDDFTSIGRRNVPSTCPICGRPATRSSACSISPSSGSVFCFHGQEYSAPEGLTSGEIHIGRNGTQYGFVRRATFQGNAFGGGSHSLFCVHQDRSETVSVPATPQPWVVESAVGTTTWDAGLDLPEPEPASEQTVDVTTAVEGPYNLDSLLEAAQGLTVLTAFDDDVMRQRIADLAVKAGTLDAYAGKAAAKRPSEAVKLAMGTGFISAKENGGIVGITDWNKWVKAAFDATTLQLAATRARDAAAKQSQLVQAVTSSMVLSDEGERWKLLLSLLPGVVADPDKPMNLQQVAKAFQPLEGSVQFNTLRNSVEVLGADGVFHGLPPDQISDLYVHLNRHGWHIAQKPAGDAVLAYARANRVNPARDYLETLRHDDSIPLIDLRTVCGQVFRHGDQFAVNDQLSSELVRTWLLGAVHRLLHPGCEFQGMLVLKGLQGTGKSRFFQSLMPDKSWCVAAQAEATGKDQREVMQRGWVIVLEELDGLTGKKAVAEMKALVTAASDVMRLSYERFAWQYPRPSVMGATVNDDNFLPDVTGNRRYWVIDTCPLWIPENLRKGYADHVAETTESLRDSIWRTALLEAEGGASQFLAAETSSQLADANVAYEPESPMFGAIKDWQQGMPQGSYATIDQVLQYSGAFGGDAARINRADQMAAGRVLLSLEWRKCRASMGSKGRHTYWVKTPNPNPTQNDLLRPVKGVDSPW
jgi:hypothetical protein